MNIGICLYSGTFSVECLLDAVTLQDQNYEMPNTLFSTLLQNNIRPILWWGNSKKNICKKCKLDFSGLFNFLLLNKFAKTVKTMKNGNQYGVFLSPDVLIPL